MNNNQSNNTRFTCYGVKTFTRWNDTKRPQNTIDLLGVKATPFSEREENAMIRVAHEKGYKTIIIFDKETLTIMTNVEITMKNIEQ